MSIKITIGNQVINFPSAGSDASWSQAVDDFAVAVADQLAGIVSPYDVSPRVQILSSDANSNLTITSAVFPNGSVRSFDFDYAIYRSNGAISIAEEGTVRGVYDTLIAVLSLQHVFLGPRQSNGTLYDSFSMSGDQLTLTTAGIGGSYDGTGSKISYYAKTNLVSNL